MVATCIGVTEEKIRAEVWMGDTLLAKTPFVLGFDVNKVRGQVDTFSVVLEINVQTTFPLGERLVVKAGTRDNIKTIATGEITETRVEPVFGKANYFKLSLAGKGVLSNLENKRFSRRLKIDGQGLYCLITSGGDRLDAWYSLDGPQTVGNREIVAPSPNLAKGMAGEHSGLIMYDGRQASAGTGGTLADIVSQPRQGGQPGAGGGLGVHDHSTIEKGGPAWGAYSVD